MDLKELKKTFKLVFPEKNEYGFDWYDGADSVYILCPVRGSNYRLTYYAAFIDLAQLFIVVNIIVKSIKDYISYLY